MDATNRLRGSGFWYTDLESANDAIAELRVRLDQRTARMAEYERVAIDESNSASMAKRERNAALARAEAAERERDEARKAVDVWKVVGAGAVGAVSDQNDANDVLLERATAAEAREVGLRDLLREVLVQWRNARACGCEACRDLIARASAAVDASVEVGKP